jgi:hypothetical protein
MTSTGVRHSRLDLELGSTDSQYNSKVTICHFNPLIYVVSHLLTENLQYHLTFANKQDSRFSRTLLPANELVRPASGLSLMQLAVDEVAFIDRADGPNPHPLGWWPMENPIRCLVRGVATLRTGRHNTHLKYVL